MSTNWNRSRGATLIVFVALLAFGGCGGDVEVIEEPPVPMEEEEAEAVFPAILHNQTIRGNTNYWRIQSKDITDVELLERTEDAATGNQIAVLWFKTEFNAQPLKIKVRVTYKRLSNQSESGLEVFSYPVSKLQTLEVKQDDG